MSREDSRQIHRMKGLRAMNNKSTQQKKPRKLRFNSISDILRDAEQICHANHVIQLGNWSAGQAFEHLAKSFCSSVTASKADISVWRRAIARVCKPIVLRYGLPAGVQIASVSDVAAREFLPRETVSVEEGYEELLRAVSAISENDMDATHNCFGKMSPEDWERMHCRHAELHLRLLLPIN